MTGPRPEASAFARRFLSDNRWKVLHLVVAEAFVVYDAAQRRWLMCALWVLIAGTALWDLIKRAAGLPTPGPRPKSREEMTPREAFWLDPSAVFDRKSRRPAA